MAMQPYARKAAPEGQPGQIMIKKQLLNPGSREMTRGERKSL
jgi:hypothetical protein